MFNDLKLEAHRPAYLQIRDYLKALIFSGVLQSGVRLPATRELAAVLGVSRNTVIQAYQYLEDDGFIRIVQGRGAFVTMEAPPSEKADVPYAWETLVTDYARTAVDLDIEKKELKWEKGYISFKSIAPDPQLFEMDDVKRSFLNRVAVEGEKLLNYGYAQGYRNLLEYLKQYMKAKGVSPDGKDILITNGFTEGFNLVLAALTRPGDRIVCENPTHNTALKIMRLAGLKVIGVPMQEDGMDVEELSRVLASQTVKLGYLIPSYHNPTGIVMSPEKRKTVLEQFQRYRVPVVEDGFNEELRYSGAHVAPMMALADNGSGMIYLGSLSKILFPGLRVGWIMADARLISYLESVKRSLNIHTSFLDQAILYEYLHTGQFEKYLKKARKVYRERHQRAVELARQLIPCRKVWGEGGLHIFIELEPSVDARQVLAEAYREKVLFMPGDIFFVNPSDGKHTFRLGISRVTPDIMGKGFTVIGRAVRRVQSGYTEAKE